MRALGISLCADVSDQLRLAAPSICTGATPGAGASAVARQRAAARGDCPGVRVCQCQSFCQSVSPGVGGYTRRVPASLRALSNLKPNTDLWLRPNATLWRVGLPTLDCEAVVKPDTSFY